MNGKAITPITRFGRRHASGFTLTELMVVLVIFGIVSAVALPGFTKFLRSVDLNSQVQRVATTLRVVRQRAITENNNYVAYWSATDHGFGWWDDDDNDGVKDGPEKYAAPEKIADWLTVTNSTTNPFPSDSISFLPNGSANVSGSVIFSNPEGYSRSLSVVRPTGMVTVQ